MRVYGITYDTGFTSAGTTTHEPFDPDLVRREMRIIRDELHCDAVRITGGVQDRLETAARHAADAGLEVWYSPFTNGLTQDELMAFLLDGAERAERIRRSGASVVFLAGSEISLFTDGFLPGGDFEARVGLMAEPARFRAALPDVRTRVNAFLGRAVAAVRDRFSGPVGYASLPFEGVDWTPFDLIATDAGYRDANSAPGFGECLAGQTSQGKPFAVTEFGCTTHRGSADLGGHGESVLEYDDRARPVRMTRPLVRDEEEQAGYIRELLDVYDEGGVDAAFVNTFARRDLPTDPDPDRDFDKASYGIVKILAPGAEHPRPDVPWAPKAAFHALSAYGRTRLPR
ncbi:hypothetical protein [Actinomadura verrucosospora]|uniref:Abortive infection protein n=1 Tax=Actinomadura verrucosospora TaxID=46165 RepID=A0A7D3ZYG4_ACTVE|nr:hypothetical protein [Actinomadura verrucosospora]QKG23146.1 hypothetical protein ACTIVE_4787 [Actinomadura verrucosospora]